MFWKNFFTMSFILSPVFILFGMIIFAGKPKDQLKRGEVSATRTESDGSQ
jgi:hypothetical protein